MTNNLTNMERVHILSSRSITTIVCVFSGVIASDCFRFYIEKISPIVQGIDNRIRFSDPSIEPTEDPSIEPTEDPNPQTTDNVPTITESTEGSSSIVMTSYYIYTIVLSIKIFL